MAERSVTKNIVFLWWAWASLCGMAVPALTAGVVIVQATSGSNAVVIASDIRDPTLEIHYGGQLRYTYDLDRKESCPGEIVTVYTSRKEEGAPAMITTRRPAYLDQIKLYNDIKVVNDLPAAVVPGPWRVRTSMTSHCANRVQSDPISDFDIEVVQ